MFKNDIRRVYTEKVTELLSQGYTIFPDTMGGHQGEIAKTDLSNGSEILRVLLEKEMCWGLIDDGFHGDELTLTVGKLPADTRIGDNWSGLAWNNRLEVRFQIKWAEIRDKGEGWYTDMEDAARIGRIRRERYRSTRMADNAILAPGTRRELGDAYKSAALGWLRKQPRMKTCEFGDIEKMECVRGERGTRYFEIRARGQRFILG